MNTVIDHRTNKHDIRHFRVRRNALLKGLTAFILPQFVNYNTVISVNVTDQLETVTVKAI